jgi:hypothetical protein
MGVIVAMIVGMLRHDRARYSDIVSIPRQAGQAAFLPGGRLVPEVVNGKISP